MRIVWIVCQSLDSALAYGQCVSLWIVCKSLLVGSAAGGAGITYSGSWGVFRKLLNLWNCTRTKTLKHSACHIRWFGSTCYRMKNVLPADEGNITDRDYPKCFHQSVSISGIFWKTIAVWDWDPSLPPCRTKTLEIFCLSRTFQYHSVASVIPNIRESIFFHFLIHICILYSRFFL